MLLIEYITQTNNQSVSYLHETSVIMFNQTPVIVVLE